MPQPQLLSRDLTDDFLLLSLCLSAAYRPLRWCLLGCVFTGESYTIREETNGFFEVEDEVLRRCTQLRPSITGDERADVTKSDYKESNCLEEEIEEVMVLPKGHIVAPTEEEVSACPKLQ